ncbi:hypothetical protein HK099_004194 [Clydaea vesicula]|uniref:WD40 repeat-like protein n=1 Tax=Clydaea vesicula TaxID=447962 RepID=A0AAD5Y3J4_9FUNG|nr:hypothetical protein HK099_004194 [Clydaea vesicula]
MSDVASMNTTTSSFALLAPKKFTLSESTKRFSRVTSNKLNKLYETKKKTAFFLKVFVNSKSNLSLRLSTSSATTLRDVTSSENFISDTSEGSINASCDEIFLPLLKMNNFAFNECITAKIFGFLSPITLLTLNLVSSNFRRFLLKIQNVLYKKFFFDESNVNFTKLDPKELEFLINKFNYYYDSGQRDLRNLETGKYELTSYKIAEERDSITSLQVNINSVIMGSRRHKLYSIEIPHSTPFLDQPFGKIDITNTGISMFPLVPTIDFKSEDGHGFPILCLDYSTNGENILVTGDQKGVICMWNLITGKLLDKKVAHLKGVSSVLVSDDNKVISTGFDKKILIFDIKRKEEIKFSEIASNDKNYTESNSRSKCDLNENKSKRIFRLMKKANLNEKISNPNSTKKSFVKSKKTPEPLEAKNEYRLVFEKELVGYKSDIVIAILIDKKRYLATASLDQTIKIWDIFTNKLLMFLSGHKDIITNLKVTLKKNDKDYCSDVSNYDSNIKNYYLFSASLDKTILQYDLENGSIKNTFISNSNSKGWLKSLAIYDKFLCFGGLSGALEITSSLGLGKF